MCTPHILRGRSIAPAITREFPSSRQSEAHEYEERNDAGGSGRGEEQ